MALTLPTLIGMAFAGGSGPNKGLVNAIPVASASPAASYADGFPILTMTNPTAGGVPPNGADFNGILNAITSFQAWSNAGGQFPFSSSLATSIGGYSKGMVVQSNDYSQAWASLCNANTGDPNAGPIAITASCATNVLTVTAVTGTPILVGMAVVGIGIPTGTTITSFGTGTGGTGTYNLSTSPGTVSSESMTVFGWTPWAGAGLRTQPGDIYLNGQSSTTRAMHLQSNGVDRWQFVVNNTAESGSNAGSDISFNSYTDAGAFLYTNLRMARANGLTYAPQGMVFGSGTNTPMTVYNEGTWTPTATGLSGTGITYSTRWVQVGNRVDITLTIIGTGVVATAGSTYLSMPFTPVRPSVIAAVNQSSLASYGNGMASTAGYLYLPNISSTNSYIVVTGTIYLS